MGRTRREIKKLHRKRERGLKERRPYPQEAEVMKAKKEAKPRPMRVSRAKRESPSPQ